MDLERIKNNIDFKEVPKIDFSDLQVTSRTETTDLFSEINNFNLPGDPVCNTLFSIFDSEKTRPHLYKIRSDLIKENIIKELPREMEQEKSRF